MNKQEILLEIKRITKSPSKIVFEPYRNYYGDSFQEIRKRVPELTKLKRIAGNCPKTNLQQILNKIHKYYCDHPQELDKI